VKFSVKIFLSAKTWSSRIDDSWSVVSSRDPYGRPAGEIEERINPIQVRRYRVTHRATSLLPTKTTPVVVWPQTLARWRNWCRRKVWVITSLRSVQLVGGFFDVAAHLRATDQSQRYYLVGGVIFSRTRPTQPFILSGSINWVVNWNQMCAAVYR